MKLYTYSSKEYTYEEVIIEVSNFPLLYREVIKHSSVGATEELIMIIKAVEFVETL